MGMNAIEEFNAVAMPFLLDVSVCKEMASCATKR
jgi:hypothetical protein